MPPVRAVDQPPCRPKRACDSSGESRRIGGMSAAPTTSPPLLCRGAMTRPGPPFWPGWAKPAIRSWPRASSATMGDGGLERPLSCLRACGEPARLLVGSGGRSTIPSRTKALTEKKAQTPRYGGGNGDGHQQELRAVATTGHTFGHKTSTMAHTASTFTHHGKSTHPTATTATHGHRGAHSTFVRRSCPEARPSPRLTRAAVHTPTPAHGLRRPPITHGTLTSPRVPSETIQHVWGGRNAHLRPKGTGGWLWRRYSLQCQTNTGSFRFRASRIICPVPGLFPSHRAMSPSAAAAICRLRSGPAARP
jgi:hypothetical protein